MCPYYGNISDKKQVGTERKECDCELQFYEDYVIFYVPKHHIGYKNDKMEVQKMYYKDVKNAEYRVNTRKIVITGIWKKLIISILKMEY